MVVLVCALIGVDPGCSLMRRNYLESNFYRYSEKFRFRERCERVLFFYDGKGKFSTEFCDASFLFVCFCTRLKFSAHASVFCFCLLLFFYAKLREALRERSRPMKKRRLACACSACHIFNTAVTLATKEETSRCRYACFLIVVDVGTTLPVVMKPRKPR